MPMPAADILASLTRAVPGVSFESADAVDQPVTVVPADALAVDGARVARHA